MAGFAWIVIISSCANQGMPTGGPKDTIPPVLVGTYPKYKALNYKGNEVRLTFDEFIVPDQVSEILVVSPPLEKRTTILTKSKTLIVRFNEDLQDSVTYSLDFKNSIIDNNERNAYENLRFVFSTSDWLDTLRVAGRVINSFNLEPVENALVMLHKNLHDSAIYTVRPNYISRTDKEGLFYFDNLAEGTYHIYSVNDENTNLKYDEGAEEIAFHDSLIVPSAQFVALTDTTVSGLDSLLVEGHIIFLPEPVFLRQFTEKIFEQYVKTTKRDSRFQCTFVFNEPVADTFNIQLIDTVVPDWYVLEPNIKYDSLTLWIADTTLAAKETIRMELSYFQLDTLEQLYLQKDTVEMQFAEKQDDSKRRRKSRSEDEDDEDDKPQPAPQFNWVSDVSTSAFDLNRDILLTSPNPLKSIDSTAFAIYLADDTLKQPLPVKFSKDTLAWRTYRLEYKWESETSYTLEVDSAASENIYGITSKALSTTFKTQSEEHYGTINLSMTGVEGNMLVQLLENTDREELIMEQSIESDQTVVFSYVAPGKYRIKIVFDDNGNGKWDFGSFQDKVQPERVAYINEVVRVRSNWDNNLKWNLKTDLTFTKNIRDRELEEQQRKEAEKKAREAREQELNTGQPQDGMFQNPGMSPF